MYILEKIEGEVWKWKLYLEENRHEEKSKHRIFGWISLKEDLGCYIQIWGKIYLKVMYVILIFFIKKFEYFNV